MRSRHSHQAAVTPASTRGLQTASRARRGRRRRGARCRRSARCGAPTAGGSSRSSGAEQRARSRIERMRAPWGLRLVNKVVVFAVGLSAAGCTVSIEADELACRRIDHSERWARAGVAEIRSRRPARPAADHSPSRARRSRHRSPGRNARPAPAPRSAPDSMRSPPRPCAMTFAGRIATAFHCVRRQTERQSGVAPASRHRHSGARRVKKGWSGG